MREPAGNLALRRDLNAEELIAFTILAGAGLEEPGEVARALLVSCVVKLELQITELGRLRGVARPCLHLLHLLNPPAGFLAPCLRCVHECTCRGVSLYSL